MRSSGLERSVLLAIHSLLSLMRYERESAVIPVFFCSFLKSHPATAGFF